MHKCSKTINRFYRAKAIVDKILSDPNTVKKIQQFILTERGRGSEEYINTYSEVDDIIRQITPERVVILKSDGQFYYDSGKKVYDAITVYNHNTRPEVMASVDFLYGGDTINKTALIKKYPKKLSCMILAGYGIASRSSSTTKTIQSYVSKTYSDKGNPLNSNIFTLRVSIKHDIDKKIKQQRLVEPEEPIEEEPIEELKAIAKRPDWFGGIEVEKDFEILDDNGVRASKTIRLLAECVSTLLEANLTSG